MTMNAPQSQFDLNR